jgi:asparagine synthase (glutamine-hydrolysing)
MGIEIESPFLDAEAIAVTAAARLQFPPQPGVQKPLLAAAMRGLVPDRILDRRGKQGFNALYYRGLAVHRDALLALAHNPPAPADQLFDTPRLKEAIRAAALGAEPLESLHGLAANLAIIKWLTLLPEWRRTRVSPARNERTAS